jgi:hypothetical protein
MIRLAVLGAGGLGKGMAQFAKHRPDFQLVAMADSQGYCYSDDGLCSETIQGLKTMADYPESGVSTEAAILDLLKAQGDKIDVIFMALPNLPVEFYADTIRMIAENTPFKGVFVDALKRTKAVEHLLPLHKLLKAHKLLYITGAGATPGFLTTVAAVAAQSFAEVLSVDIHFGVGIANWEAYKATIREDFLHLDGFDAHRVAEMTDAEIEAELDARNGLIELVNMEHADDIILELAGICTRDRVSVGGVVDTRNAKKPVSTTVTVTGQTVAGKIGSHRFTVSDETTMVDNVCGPALGFLLRGFSMRSEGRYGLLTSADLMPRLANQVQKVEEKQLVTV